MKFKKYVKFEMFSTSTYHAHRRFILSLCSYIRFFNEINMRKKIYSSGGAEHPAGDAETNSLISKHLQISIHT